MEEFLVRIPLFSILSKEELAFLSQNGREQCYPQGGVVFKEGDSADWVWVVKEGWIRLVRHTASGKLITIFTMTPEEVLCGLSAFDHGTYSASGIAATESLLIRIPTSNFSRLMDQNPAFVRQVLSICCHRIKRMGYAYSMAYESVGDRVISVLLRLYEKFGEELPFTKREVAQMAGTTTETCIRTLSRMRQKGWVNGRRGKLTLINLQSLRQSLNNPEKLIV